MFNPLKTNVEIKEGWENISPDFPSILTKQNSSEQENSPSSCYDDAISNKGGISLENKNHEYRISLKNMRYKDDWHAFLSLAGKLDEAGVRFKFDGKTMIFAHGLKFKLEKICAAFKWNDEQIVKEFLSMTGNAKAPSKALVISKLPGILLFAACPFFHGSCRPVYQSG